MRMGLKPVPMPSSVSLKRTFMHTSRAGQKIALNVSSITEKEETLLLEKVVIRKYSSHAQGI